MQKETDVFKAASAEPPTLFSIPHQNHLMFSVLNVMKNNRGSVHAEVC